MMDGFLAQGIKTIVITEPYLVELSPNYYAASSIGFLGKTSSGQTYDISNFWACGCDAGLLDITNPGAQQWWWSLHPAFMGTEMAGLWTDLGEPETHPADMVHYLGGEMKVHNIYDLLWARTDFEGFSQNRPNRRFFNLTRSGYAGIQKYGVSIWSGDVQKSFGGLSVQLPMLLNMGISGIGYHNSDIGGFSNGTPSAELYERWMEYGTFCPIARAHGYDGIAQTEPWAYGPAAENICRTYIQLRYQLLPYIYTTAHQNYVSGMPLARPLFFNNPDDDNLWNESDSYMWGDAFLVSPVVQQGQTDKGVYLPEGGWIDYWTDQLYEGPGTIDVQAPVNILPLFVKEGSIIPAQGVMNYSNERPLDTLRLLMYPHPTLATTDTLYEDDDSTLAYQTGSFALTVFQQQFSISNGTASSYTMLIGAPQGSYAGMPANRIYLAEIHRITSSDTVRVNGTAISLQTSYANLRLNGGFFYDPNANVLYIQFRSQPATSYTIIAENAGTLTSVKNRGEVLPRHFQLEQNYPNPFNPSTIIGYSLSQGERVRLKIFNVLGEEVYTLVDAEKPAGSYSVVWNASMLPAGVYFCRMETPLSVETKKAVLMK
jgi:alpha-glucosidase (family GH31 glycosyl hydrolase)